MTIEASCPKFLEPRIRLFLSADIIGSTAQKQSRLGALGKVGAASEASWFTTIQGFYFEAQQSMRSAWKDLQSQHQSPDHFGEPPVLWKTVGDEVLFTKIITDHRQVAVTIQCWMKALDLIREFLVRDSARLGVKSTVWLAGFPFRNKEVVLSGDSFSEQAPIDDYYRENGRILNRMYSEEKGSPILVDYVGPSIDTGFRLTGLATARKLVLSIEVAYILAMTSPVKAGPIEEIQLRYHGQVALKGVLGGAGYPVFWISLSKTASADTLEDLLTNEQVCDRDAVWKYCDAFFQENESLIFPPFIESATETTFSQRPSWYDEHHSNLVKNFIESTTAPPEPDDVVASSEQFSVQLSKFSTLLKHLHDVETVKEKKPVWVHLLDVAAKVAPNADAPSSGLGEEPKPTE